MTTLSHTSSLVTQGKAVFTAVAVCFVLSCSAVSAEESTKVNTESQDAIKKIELKEIDKNAFEYQLEGRKDPFVPFITPKIKSPQVDMNAIVDTNEELTGMMLFEPGQLTLVGIMKMDDKFIAMVQDSTGKGYTITEEMRIGKRGMIKKISPNRVLIEETATTRAGKLIKNNIQMILKKEGE